MRVVHLVAADRWTGAAATALATVEALRGQGWDVQFAFRPGRNLQDRLAAMPWAHGMLLKERSVADVRANLRSLRALTEGARILHAHLPHDHILALAAARHGATRIPVVRSVRHPRHVRLDPFQWLLFRHTAGAAVAYAAMLPQVHRAGLRRCRPAVVTPPVLETRFSPDPESGAQVRQRLGVPPEAVVVGTVGKLHSHRGQDLLLRALSACPGVWGLVVGDGEYAGALAHLAGRLDIAARTVFTGFVDRGLERFYAAMDLSVFPACGSDWGHRMVVESLGCGVPCLAADVPGVRDLITERMHGDFFPPGDAAALAQLLLDWTQRNSPRRAASFRLRQSGLLRPPQALATAITGLYELVLRYQGDRETPA